MSIMDKQTAFATLVWFKLQRQLASEDFENGVVHQNQYEKRIAYLFKKIRYYERLLKKLN